MNAPLNRQPDNPGAFCPCCGQHWPDQDGDLERLVRKNIGRVSLHVIADAAKTSLSHVERVAARVLSKRRRA